MENGLYRIRHIYGRNVHFSPSSFFNLQEASSTEMSGWLVAPMHGKAEWKSIISVAMAQCAITDGAILMLKWYADSWDSIQKVRIH